MTGSFLSEGQASASPQFGAGYCYLRLVRQDSRERAKAALGENPYMSVVFAWLQLNIGVWTSVKFRYILGRAPGTGDGRAFLQAHVEESDHGLTVTQLLQLPSGGIRLGAEPTDDPQVQQVPQALPDPKHHPIVLMDGLFDWFRTLRSEVARMFLRYLFNFDPDQQSPAPGLFLQPLSNYRVAAVYDMCQAEDRTSFDRLVTWKGLEDYPEPPDPETKGWCYLHLFRGAYRWNAARKFGAYPEVGEVYYHLRNLPDEASPGTFHLTTRAEGTGTVSHVYPSDSGRDPVTLLAAFGFTSKLGAATSDKLALVSDGQVALVEGPPSAFDMLPNRPGTRLTLSMFALLDKSKHNPTISWSPMTQTQFTIILGIYESVRLESAEFSVSVTTGQANSVWCAITNASAPGPNTTAEWYGCPVFKSVDGSDDGKVVDSFELPPTHGFAKELRAAAIGNDPPRFHFGYSGVAGGSGLVMGKFVVTVSGERPLGSFDANPEKVKLSAEARAIVCSLPYLVTRPCARESADEDSDESEDEAAPARGSPPARAPRAS